MKKADRYFFSRKKSSQKAFFQKSDGKKNRKSCFRTLRGKHSRKAFSPKSGGKKNQKSCFRTFRGKHSLRIFSPNFGEKNSRMTFSLSLRRNNYGSVVKKNGHQLHGQKFFLMMSHIAPAAKRFWFLVWND